MDSCADRQQSRVILLFKFFLTGNPMPQQYITIPVSLGMGSAQPIQILANPPIMAGLQQFTMIPSQVGTTPEANVSSIDQGLGECSVIK